MPSAARELEPRLKRSERLSPEDKLELERQKELLASAFTAPEYTANPKQVHILAALRTRAEAVRQGEIPLEEFMHFQSSVFGTVDYAFLEYTHPGLNVSGWRVLLAIADPLKYGREIRTVIQKRGTSGKRG